MTCFETMSEAVSKRPQSKSIGSLGDKLTLLLRSVPVVLHTFGISNEWLSMLLLMGVSVRCAGVKAGVRMNVGQQMMPKPEHVMRVSLEDQ